MILHYKVKYEPYVFSLVALLYDTYTRRDDCIMYDVHDRSWM